MQVAASPAPNTVAVQCGTCGVRAARAVHGPTGMCGRTTQVQTTHKGFRTTETRNRPEDGLLVERQGPADAGADRGNIAGPLHISADQGVAEARRVGLDHRVDVRGELVGGAVVGDAARHQGVGPRGFGSGR
nr:hypothetical protein [Nocardia seriolae]